MSPSCQICAHATTRGVLHGGFRYWKCDSCGTSQIFPQPTPYELDEYYNRFHLSAEEGGEYAVFEERMKADFPTKVRMARALAPASSAALLDVGCGKGFFLREAVDAGFRAQGIDLSASGVDFATQQLNVMAIAGRIDETCPSEWNEAFDIATCWATIEHLPHPLATLRAIHRCLKPGGILLVDTGLGDAPFEALLPGHSQWYDAPQHLWVFSAKGLRACLEQAGFSVVAVDTNFERSLFRRWVKWFRHFAVCVLSYSILRALLGSVGFNKMKEEAKWPVGRLLSIQACKVRGKAV